MSCSSTGKFATIWFHLPVNLTILSHFHRWNVPAYSVGHWWISPRISTFISCHSTRGSRERHLLLNISVENNVSGFRRLIGFASIEAKGIFTFNVYFWGVPKACLPCLNSAEHKSKSMKLPEDKSNPCLCYHLLYNVGVWNRKVYLRLIAVGIKFIKILIFSKEFLNQS